MGDGGCEASPKLVNLKRKHTASATGDTREELLHGGAEAVRAVQLARGLAARDADDFVRRAPLDNFRNQNRSNDKFRPSVQSSLGVVDVENSTAAGQDVGAGGKSGNRVEAAWGGEGEFNELEATRHCSKDNNNENKIRENS